MRCLFGFDYYISIGVDLPVRILDVRLRRLARERVRSRFSPCAIRKVNIS